MNTMIQNPPQSEEDILAAATLACLSIEASKTHFVEIASNNVPIPASSRSSACPPKAIEIIFPRRLFDILEESHHEDIIQWIPNGKAFRILDKERFTKELLPFYFKKTQYASFARKLSRWKFARISRGAFVGAFYNEFFQRDYKDLTNLMECTSSTKKSESHSYLLQSSSSLPSSYSGRTCNLLQSMPTRKIKQLLQRSSFSLGAVDDLQPLRIPLFSSNLKPHFMLTNQRISMDTAILRGLQIHREQQRIHSLYKTRSLEVSQSNSSNLKTKKVRFSENNFKKDSPQGIITEAVRVLERSLEIDENKLVTDLKRREFLVRRSRGLNM